MHTDLSAAFAHAPLPERLRHLAQLAEEAEVAAPDVYGEAPGLQRFEAEVAELLGKEAGVFFSTGTLAQRAALHVHTEQLKAPKGRVIVHPSSHLVHHDCLRDGQAQSKRVRTEVSTRLPTFVVEFAGDLQRPLALTDLIGPQSAGVLEGDVVVVELPQRMNGGRTMAWADIQQLSKLAKDVGARMHMDGARLWEVQPFYGCSLRDVCTLFDSVYVSFYKGLGAMSGAMLCGDKSFVAASKELRTRLGGSVFTFAPQWLDARAQLSECTQEGFGQRFKKLQEVVRVLSEDSTVRQIVRFEPPIPEACLVHAYLQGSEEGLEAAHARACERTGLRLWGKLRGRGYSMDCENSNGDASHDECYFEWPMGPANCALPIEAFLKGWRALAEELTAPASVASKDPE